MTEVCTVNDVGKEYSTCRINSGVGENEYLATLQQQAKLSSRKRNVNVGDIVLLKDGDQFRNDWVMAMVLTVKRSNDDLVRSVTIKTKNGVFERPIHKLVPLTHIQTND